MSSKMGVVIGVGPGLGRSLALRMADAGLSVTVLARNPDSAAEVAREVRAKGVATHSGALDAADPAEVSRVVGELAERYEIAALAYNAMSRGGRIGDAPVETLIRAQNVNLHSPLAAVQAAVDNLSRNNARVLLTGGGLALHPSAEAGLLSVGKASLRALALLLAQDLAPRGITVRTLTIAGRIGSSEELAADTIAHVFWAMAEGPDPEFVYPM